MLDFSRSKYSEDWVVKEIEKIMATLNINHMPSRSEIEAVTKSTKLVNLIIRTGGFRAWAEKLNLKIKGSETEFGYMYEKLTQKHIADMGYSAELTPVKFPYDILVDGVTKLDVKAGREYHCPTGTSWYSFNLEAVYPKCDFLVVYCIGTIKVDRTYIIPAHVLRGCKQLSMGKDTKYRKYADRWDLIEKHIAAMKSVV